MDKELNNISKSISDLKLSIVIALLVAFIVSSVFVWGMINSKLNDISVVVYDIENKTYNKLAN